MVSGLSADCTEIVIRPVQFPSNKATSRGCPDANSSILINFTTCMTRVFRNKIDSTRLHWKASPELRKKCSSFEPEYILCHRFVKFKLSYISSIVTQVIMKLHSVTSFDHADLSFHWQIRTEVSGVEFLPLPSPW